MDEFDILFVNTDFFEFLQREFDLLAREATLEELDEFAGGELTTGGQTFEDKSPENQEDTFYKIDREFRDAAAGATIEDMILWTFGNVEEAMIKYKNR